MTIMNMIITGKKNNIFIGYINITDNKINYFYIKKSIDNFVLDLQIINFQLVFQFQYL